MARNRLKWCKTCDKALFTCRHAINPRVALKRQAERAKKHYAVIK